MSGWLDAALTVSWFIQTWSECKFNIVSSIIIAWGVLSTVQHWLRSPPSLPVIVLYLQRSEGNSSQKCGLIMESGGKMHSSVVNYQPALPIVPRACHHRRVFIPRDAPSSHIGIMRCFQEEETQLKSGWKANIEPFWTASTSGNQREARWRQTPGQGCDCRLQEPARLHRPLTTSCITSRSGGKPRLPDTFLSSILAICQIQYSKSNTHKQMCLL